jgi:F-type H+-transporting ATPase subunit delta
LASLSGETSIVAQRYAGALLDLARSNGEIEGVEQSLDRLSGLMRENPDLRQLVTSPLFSSAEQQSALTAIFEKAQFRGLVRDFILTLAKNRRLFALESIIGTFKDMASAERGEVMAYISSAVPLNQAQAQSLIDTLRQTLGKTPRIEVTVDPSLLGGLVVKVGSRMIDTSLRSKLKNLELAMKEAS